VGLGASGLGPWGGWCESDEACAGFLVRCDALFLMLETLSRSFALLEVDDFKLRFFM